MIEWRMVEVDGFEGRYKISNFGEVWSIKSRKLLKIMQNADGYCVVALAKNGKRKLTKVHRLVAFAFLPVIEGKDFVNHIDENKKNNSVDNLEWCTHKENVNHGTGIARRARTRSIAVVGVHIKNNDIIEFASTQEAQRNGYSSGHISECLNRKIETHKEYRWYRKEEFKS